MPDLIKQAGIKQADGTYEMKDIGVDYENVDGLSTEATSFKAVNDKNEKDITTYIAGASKEDENLVLTDGAGSTSSVDLSMTGATANENGEAGFVPAPTAADRTKYLKGDGTWAEPVNEDINVEVPWYGVCASAATAAAKVVSTTSGNFELSNGAKVVVKFNNGNTSDSVLSLNVDNTGATPIKLFDSNTNNLRDYKINANDIIEFVYTGNYFVAMPSMSELSHMQDDRVWSATCSTSAASSAKFATTTVNGNNTAGFSLATGVKVRVKFTYANTALTPTLSVNGSTDKDIKAFGTTAPGFWWKAGDVVDFTYDGTNWIMSPSAGQLDKIGESVGFIGTRAEINEAMAAGAIPDGMLVYCTDDLTGFPVNADDVIYDNTESGLTATNVQDAIDEVASDISEINSALSDKVNTSDIKNNLTSTDTNKPLSANMGKKLNDEKLAKSGGTLTGSLVLNNGTNDTPEIKFQTKDYGNSWMDMLNNAFRLFVGSDKTGQNPKQYLFKTDALYADGLNLEYENRVHIGTKWTDAPNNTFSVYKYEGADVTTYNLPHPHVMVLVMKSSGNGGTAVAFQWNANTNAKPNIWVNSLWGGWKGWAKISGSSVQIWNKTLVLHDSVTINAEMYSSITIEIVYDNQVQDSQTFPTTSTEFRTLSNHSNSIYAMFRYINNNLSVEALSSAVPSVRVWGNF